MKQRIELTDGFAYLEFKAVYDKVFEDGVMTNKPLLSKKREPMISIVWSVVDCKGNHGSIRDYIVPSTIWKIINLQNALQIKNLFNRRENAFDISLIKHRCCASTIKQDENPEYGSKIVSYVPIEFVKLVVDQRGDNQDKNKVSPTGDSNPMSIVRKINPEKDTQWSLGDSDTMSIVRDDDDDIPF